MNLDGLHSIVQQCAVSCLLSIMEKGTTWIFFTYTFLRSGMWRLDLRLLPQYNECVDQILAIPSVYVGIGIILCLQSAYTRFLLFPVLHKKWQKQLFILWINFISLSDTKLYSRVAPWQKLVLTYTWLLKESQIDTYMGIYVVK